MKSLVEKFGYNQILDYCKRKNYRLPTLDEARFHPTEHKAFWVSGEVTEPGLKTTHALLYSRKLDDVEIVQKNFRFTSCIVKLKTNDEYTVERDKFIEDVFEIAFGDNAINRNFTTEEVLETLKEFSEKSYMYEQLEK